MRIVHVSDCYLPRLGGIEMQVEDLARRQIEAGHEVTVLTSTAGGPPTDGGADCAHQPALVRVAGSNRGGIEQIVYRATRRGARELTSTLGDYDLVHVHASSFSPLAFLCAHHAARRGTPTVATVHSLWAKATPLFLAADRLTGWGKWPVAWSAVSNAAAAALRDIAESGAPVTILANGIEPGDWDVLHDGGAQGVLRIAAVSRLARRKRVLQLVEILQAAHDRLSPGFHLDASILGEGPQRRDIERHLRRHDMESWVKLPGRATRTQIRDVFAHTDLFVAPASLESFGIAALEARCAGLPVLARAGTGVEDFVAHGREGWLVPSDAAMVDMIVALADAPDLLSRVSEHNRTVPARISWKVVLEECEDLYEQAAARHGRAWARAGTAGPAIGSRVAEGKKG